MSDFFFFKRKNETKKKGKKRKENKKNGHDDDDDVGSKDSNIELLSCVREKTPRPFGASHLLCRPRHVYRGRICWARRFLTDGAPSSTEEPQLVPNIVKKKSYVCSILRYFFE